MAGFATDSGKRSFYSFSIIRNALPVCFLPAGVAAIDRIGALRGKGAAAGLADRILSLFQPPLPFVPPNNNVHYPSAKPTDRFYIQKSKSFFVNGRIYYEITVTPADDYSSKFNRFTVFANREIPVYYAIKLSFIDTEIDILERKMPIRIIDSFLVAIRPVEFEDLSKILNMQKVGTGTKEYHTMMEFLTASGMSISELVIADDRYYNSVKSTILSLSKSNNLFQSLDYCRKLKRQSACL